MRIFLSIIFLTAISVSGHSQSDTTYHLLWFKGKKLAPNVLVTPQSDTVRFSPAKGQLKVSAKAGAGKAFDAMLAELNQNQRRAQTLVSRLAAASPKAVLPQLAEAVKWAYDDVDSTYRKILSNTITLPANDFAIPALSTGKGGDGGPLEWEDIWEEFIRKMQQYAAQHAGDNLSTLPEPPPVDFSYCYNCDKVAKERYGKKVEAFIAALAGEEDRKMLNLALSASRQAELLLDATKNGRVQGEIAKLMQFIMLRIQKRVVMVIKQYIDDPERCMAVLQAALTWDRQVQLLGIGDVLPQDYFPKAFRAFTARIKQAMAQEDYSVALNFFLIINTERQMQLCGSGFYEDILNEGLTFNQFKVTMDVAAKTGSEKGFLLAQLRGDNWFMAFPDSNCRLRWSLVGPKMNKLTIELESADMRGNGGQIPYVGTKKWEAPVPNIHVDFCGQPTDSIIAYPFNAENFIELWKMPPPMGPTNLQQINGLLMTSFLDPEQLKADAAAAKSPDQRKKLQDEMTEKYERYLKQYQSGTISMHDKDVDIKTLMDIGRSQAAARDISAMVYSIRPGRFIFTPVVHNREKLVVQDRINGKTLFPKNTAIQYAIFDLKIEHDLSAPYVIRL